jgi:hypothetical protein
MNPSPPHSHTEKKKEDENLFYKGKRSSLSLIGTFSGEAKLTTQRLIYQCGNPLVFLRKKRRDLDFKKK